MVKVLPDDITICFVSANAYCYFNPNFKSKMQVGGAERQIFLLSKSLARNKNLRIQCCVADFGQPEHEIFDKVLVAKSFSFQESKLKALFTLQKTLRKLDADWYVLRAPYLGTIVVAFLIRFLLRKKVCYMLASDIELNKKDLKYWFGRITALIFQYIYSLVHQVTVQSENQFEKLLLINPKLKVILVRNIFSGKCSETSIGKSIVLWVGKAHPWKQPEVFFRLCRDFPKQKFVMICPEAQDAVYFKQLQDTTIAIRNLQFLSLVSSDIIHKYFEKSKVFVLTSKSEGFANTMMEAMAAQNAILSLNVNPDDIINKFNLGLFSNNSYQEMNKQLRYLLSNDTIRESMGEAGCKYLHHWHNEERVVSEFLEIL